jgi:phage terminase large subunit
MARRSIANQVRENLPEKPRKLSIEATKVFYQNYYCKKPIIVNRGGAGSSKSHSLAQLIFGVKFLGEENKKILILRKTLPALRLSVYLLMQQIREEMGMSDDVIEEKVNFNWYYDNNMIHFGSLDDPEKVKSTEWNYIWMEEATEFTFEDFKTLLLRLRAPSTDGNRNQLFLSFNPIDEFHWIKDKMLRDPTWNCAEFVSTYRDNPFLPDEYKERLEALQHQDPTSWLIYAEGIWGKLENLIYKNWEIVSSMPSYSQVDHVVYGLDFGFNAPTALTEQRIDVKAKKVWERELMYATKLTNEDLIGKLDVLIPRECRKYTIYADNAEPDRIEEIKRAGWKIKPSLKNITAGIDTVKRFTYYILEDSINLIKEKRAYSWRKDRNGNILDEPVDFLNHLMDAERYALYTHLRSGNQFRIRFI